MKLPLSWLKEFVDLTCTVPELIDKLTLAGLEVINVKLIGVPAPEGLRCKIDEPGPVWAKDKIITAKILEISKVPETDKLKFVKLDLGKGGEPKTVITGAGNIAPGESGQVVVLAYAGSVLIDGHSDKRELKELKPKPIRGFPSDSMVCSVLELGISDDHEGILLLPGETPVGVPLVDILGDVVLELDVLPNMARCNSIVGLAREIAALTGQRLKSPSVAVSQQGASIEGKVKVEIADSNLSRRYTAMLINGITIQPSPYWMQRRLAMVGMRPINNVVDITNYMMIKTGQPLHAFDYDKLLTRSGGQEPTITVRLAQPGEKLVTLDNVERKLEPHHLVIADAKGVIALAGVMGGLETEVTATTKNVLLESAHFHAASIRKTARELNLFSEASIRFSKGLHPEMALTTAERTCEMLRQLGGGTVAQGTIDCYPAPLPNNPVELDVHYVQRLLGMPIPTAEIVRILRSLEYQVTENSGSASKLSVTAPQHRVDIQHGPADMVEDIARIYGYDKLPTSSLADALPVQWDNIALLGEERIRDILAGLGLQEVMTYTLTAPEKEQPLGITGSAVTLANPIHSERGILRRSLLASVLQVASSNLKQRAGVRFFEIGQVYLPVDGAVLPQEIRRLSIVITGPRTTEHWDSQSVAVPMDFFDLKGIVQALLSRLHLEKVSYEPVQTPELHPGQSANIKVGDIIIGKLGQLHPSLLANYELGRRKVFVADIDVDALLAITPDTHQLGTISTFPPMLEDIALVVDEALPAAKLEAELRAGGGELLRRVKLFDVYRGANLPEGKKSLAFALTYQATDRSLTDKEVSKVRAKIIGRVEKLLGATLRA